MKPFALATFVAGLILAAQASWAQTEPAPVQPAPPTATAPAAPGAPSANAPIPIAPPPQAVTQQITVDTLEDMPLVTTSGDNLGDIEGVVENTSDKKQYVLVERGGFLGFFTTEIAIPLENLQVQNNRLVLRNGSKADIDGMPAFKNEANAYRELDDTQTVSVAQRS